MPIQWETLITHGDGKVSWHRVRKMFSTLMGLAGAAAMVGALVVEVATGASVPLGMVAVVGSILVAPMTGGQVADAISGKFRADKFRSGELPDRRSDSQRPPTGE